MSAYGHRGYRKLRAKLIREARADGRPCCLCHGDKGPIDYDAPAGEPLAATAQHHHALANGGHILGDMDVAHHSCNASAGKRAGIKRIKRPKTSRDWYSR